MQQSTASLRLDNGLRVRLISDPAAGRAAALMRIEAGSQQEPQAWPGLAHLLEHMLFRGGEAFAAEDGLMRWVPAHGGRLNATTRATQTAFFFEVDAAQLGAGTDRLIDMLSAPLLAPEAAMQEAGIIDAEYRLLRTDAETLCEAAQRQAFGLHRFHIGNRAAFGEDAAALQHALRQYHRQHYGAANMTLWLQGPQPLAQLRRLARQLASRLPAEPAGPPGAAVALAARGDYALALPGAPQLRLTLALNQAPAARRSWLRLLQCLLQDEAPGSLLAWLRAQEYGDEVRLIHARYGEQCALLTFAFSLNQGTAEEAAAVEAALFGWLRQLSTLTQAQLAHYRRLANLAFARLAPLEQLRERAFGLPPVQEAGEWPQQLAALQQAPLSRLLTRQEVGGESAEVQGLPLTLVPFVPNGQKPSIAHFHFFRPMALPQPAPLPASRAPLQHLAPGQPQPVLQLRPSPSTPLSEAQGYRLQTALRITAAALAHHDGHLSFERFQGVWLLQLSGDDALMHYGINAINQALSAFSPAVMRAAERVEQRARQREQNDIAIRRLLGQLPAALSGKPADEVRWQASLFGGGEALRQQLAHSLSDFPYPLIAAAPLAQSLAGAPVSLAERGAENALLLFFPLPEITAAGRVALRLLAQLYAPQYFQQLRVEKNIGYVVQCAYHRCADVEGVFFALQSPRFTIEQLNQFTAEFLRQQQPVLAQLGAADWERAKATLAQTLRQRNGDALRLARENTCENSLLTEHLSQLSQQELQRWQRRIFTFI
ncbi:Protease 3 precursor [Serratia entomophila]|uniref:pyrroloquinoline quinone biosynthesis protein PqqF n=1 Tax=Serratia entomophila TaxID=42906 RepID=UPI002177A221|nr:pyrroloquinoline quinone biosynthesis protein PqqF [Serratia entomophila]CAI0800853.1 Protease 3 precursor [Serratia entomophila]CAI1592528.1 Protease 3 precursor [Serratia entomophila]